MKSYTLKAVAAIIMYAFCFGCSSTPPLKDVSYSPQLKFPSSQRKYELNAALYISPEFINTSATSTFDKKDDPKKGFKSQIDVGKSAEEFITSVSKTMFSSVNFYYDQNYLPGCDKYDVIFDSQIAASPLRGMKETNLNQETTAALLVRCPEAYPTKAEFYGKSTAFFPNPEKDNLQITKGQEIAKALTELSLKNALAEMFNKLENSSELSQIAKNQNTDEQKAKYYTYASAMNNEMAEKEIQERLDAKFSSDSAKTIAQGTAIGAGVGTIAGYGARRDLGGAIAGAIAGAAVGAITGAIVDAQKKAYVQKEEELNEKIYLVNTQNRDQERYNRILSSKIRIMNDEVSSLVAQYQAGTIQFDDMQKRREEIVYDISMSEQRKNSLEKELVALNAFYKTLEENIPKDNPGKFARLSHMGKLTQEIASLRASIDILDTNTKQLAKMADELSSVRK